jgi:hypothetical protein
MIESIGFAPHLETSGEIALTLSKGKNNVLFSWIGSDVPFNDWSIPKYSRYFGCSIEKRVKSFLDLLEKNKINIIKCPKLSPLLLKKIYIWAYKFEGSINDLKKYNYKNVPLGISVASSLISYYKDPYLNPENKKLTYSSLISSAIVYERALAILSSAHPQVIYTFNGRFCISKPIVEAAKKLSIKVRFHERGSSLYKYEIYDKPIHNFSYTEKKIRKFWIDSNKKDKSFLGSSYFSNLRYPSSNIPQNFTSKQIKGLSIPKIFEKTRIVYFSSSDDEYEAISDQFGKIYWSNQIEAAKDLIAITKLYNNFDLIIRLHPNLINKSPSQLREWVKLSDSHLRIILPSDKVDSYALLESADVVFSYGSTIGIEAVFWGKISALLGPSWYQNSNGIHRIKSLAHLRRFLKNIEEIKPSKDNDARIYGYYLHSFGIPFKFYKPLKSSEGIFLGSKLEWKSKFIISLSSIFSFYFKLLSYLRKFFSN